MRCAKVDVYPQKGNTRLAIRILNMYCIKAIACCVNVPSAWCRRLYSAYGTACQRFIITRGVQTQCLINHHREPSFVQHVPYQLPTYKTFTLSNEAIPLSYLPHNSNTSNNLSRNTKTAIPLRRETNQPLVPDLRRTTVSPSAILESIHDTSEHDGTTNDTQSVSRDGSQ